MRDFQVVFNYEFKQQFAKKAVRVTTITLMVLMLVITSIPRIIELFSSDKAPQTAQTAQMDSVLTNKVGYVFADEAQKKQLSQILGLQADNHYASRDELVAALKDHRLKAGFVLGADGAYESIYQDKGLDDEQDTRFKAFMTQYQKEKLLQQKGLTQEEFSQIDAYQPQVTSTVMGKTAANNMLVAMVLLFSVYMLVLLYGQSTATSIAREKDSKAMELLITSTRPAPLILGKVAASGLAGLLQFGAIVVAALIGIQLNKELYPPELMMMLSGSMTTGYLLSFIFFSMAGYILYLFLYAALGSTVSRVEDVGSATGLVSFIFMLGYFASSFAMNMPGSALAVGTSLFPFTAVMVMPLRSGIMTVPAWQYVVAGGLMIAVILLFAWLSIKIYRWGSLNYGNQTSIVKVFKEALRPEKRQRKA